MSLENLLQEWDRRAEDCRLARPWNRRHRRELQIMAQTWELAASQLRSDCVFEPPVCPPRDVLIGPR